VHDVPAAKEPDKGHGKAEEEDDQGAAEALVLVMHDQNRPVQWLAVRRATANRKNRVVLPCTRKERRWIKQTLVGVNLSYTHRRRRCKHVRKPCACAHTEAQRPPAGSRLEADDFAPGLSLCVVHMHLDALRHCCWRPARRLTCEYRARRRARRRPRCALASAARRQEQEQQAGVAAAAAVWRGGGGMVHTASAPGARASAPQGPSQTRRLRRQTRRLRRGARGCRAAGATGPRCRPHRRAARAHRARAAEAP